VSRGNLTSVHPERYVKAIQEFCERGGGMIDADTLASSGSWDAALHAAGGASGLVDRLMEGAAPTGISVARPPGHHAEATRPMGFCLFNNIAVAARRALDEHGAQRVLIVDWDVHHGNGTEAIFEDDAAVLFASIHQRPLYPGTGAADDVGRGDGEGYAVNLPVPAGSGDAAFCSLVEHVVVALARAFEPRLVLVSAGFDAHRDDPLAGCEVTEGGFAAMARSLRAVADDIGAPVGAVLEGGYELGALARSVAATMEELADPTPGPAFEIDIHPLAAEAATRLTRYWPQLSGALG
jgi:acetoin utilization deacetylase AcuC-like enzyme